MATRASAKKHFKEGKASVKHLTLLLVVVLAFNSVAVTQATPTGEASQATKIKTGVQRRGIGEKSRVKVKLRNKAEVKGYISRPVPWSFSTSA